MRPRRRWTSSRRESSRWFCPSTFPALPGPSAAASAEGPASASDPSLPASTLPLSESVWKPLMTDLGRDLFAC